MAILLQQKNFGPNVIYFALRITEGRGAIGPLICPNTHRGKKFRGRLFAYPQEASPELFSPVRPTSFLFDSSSITIKTIAHIHTPQKFAPLNGRVRLFISVLRYQLPVYSILTYLPTSISVLYLDTYILRSLILGPPWGPKVAKGYLRRTLELTLAALGRP